MATSHAQRLFAYYFKSFLHIFNTQGMISFKQRSQSLHTTPELGLIIDSRQIVKEKRNE